MKIANGLLAPTTVGVAPQPTGSSITVRTPDGRVATVDDFGSLWSTVATLTGVRVDAVVNPTNTDEEQG